MEKLKKGRMAVTNVSETTIPDVQVITTCKAEGDPGYIVTNCTSPLRGVCSSQI